MSRRLGLIAIASAALAGLAGCSAVNNPCGRECPTGQVCDPALRRCLDIRPANCPMDLGRYLSLALDSSGNLVFSAYTAEFGDLVVGRELTDGTVVCEYVDGMPNASGAGARADPPADPVLGDDVGLYSSLALDMLDQPTVAYFDRTHGRLKVASHAASGWKITTVPEAAGADHLVGRACSLALDSEGLPHVAYFDETAGEIKLAVQYSDGRWTVEVVDDGGSGAWGGNLGGEVGQMISLVLAAKDREWIAYRDVRSGSLKMAGHDPEGWIRQVLDDGPDVGSFVSTALDAAGNVAVAYHDRGQGSLKYAWNQSGALKHAVVDDGWRLELDGRERQLPVGQHCALAFGRDGLSRILYLDGGNFGLFLVQGKKGGGFSEREALDSQGAVGFFNALVCRGGALRGGSFAYSRDAQGNPLGDLRRYRLDPGVTVLGGGP